MPPFEKHIFICTNERSPENPTGCCKLKGSEKIAAYFKEEVKKRGLQGRVRANLSGCLDACAKGPTVVVYPEGVWYSVQNLEDAKEIMDKHIGNNQIVEKLRFA